MKRVLWRMYLTAWALAVLWAIGFGGFVLLDGKTPEPRQERPGYTFMRDSIGYIDQVSNEEVPDKLTEGWTRATLREARTEDERRASDGQAMVRWLLGLALAPVGLLGILHIWIRWLASPGPGAPDAAPRP